MPLDPAATGIGSVGYNGTSKMNQLRKAIMTTQIRHVCMYVRMSLCMYVLLLLLLLYDGLGTSADTMPRTSQ